LATGKRKNEPKVDQCEGGEWVKKR
jgi:hypothetical protein